MTWDLIRGIHDAKCGKVGLGSDLYHAQECHSSQDGRGEQFPVAGSGFCGGWGRLEVSSIYTKQKSWNV